MLRRLVLAFVVVATAAACRAESTAPVAIHLSPPTPATTNAPDSPTATSAATTPSARATAAVHRATTSPRGYVVLAGGAVLPNRTLTPGAVNAAVTQATIHATICLTGYTKTIRPSSSYTTALKRTQLSSGYSYRGDLNTSDYEEDHLISLELGGAPASVKNLWPEPYAVAEGARVKDKVENRLHDLVCSGALPLRTAQKAIATNWWTAYLRYGGSGAPSAYDGSYGTTTTTGTTSGSTTSTGSSTSSGPTAQCRDGSYSYSQHRSGTCSHHGGVDHWINPPPS